MTRQRLFQQRGAGAWEANKEYVTGDIGNGRRGQVGGPRPGRRGGEIVVQHVRLRQRVGARKRRRVELAQEFGRLRVGVERPGRIAGAVLGVAEQAERDGAVDLGWPKPRKQHGQALDCCGEPVLRVVGHRERDVRELVARIGAQRLLGMAARDFELATDCLGIGQPRQGFGIIGIERHGALEIAAGAVDLTQAFVRQPAIVDRLRHARIGEDRGVEGADRFAVIFQIVVRDAGHVEEVGVLGRQRETFAQQRQCLRVASLAHLAGGEDVEESGMSVAFVDRGLRPGESARHVVRLQRGIDGVRQHLKAQRPGIGRASWQVDHRCDRRVRGDGPDRPAALTARAGWSRPRSTRSCRPSSCPDSWRRPCRIPGRSGLRVLRP